MDLQTWLRKDIPVDPAVRLTRLVRSRSGRFEDAYELREKDVLGTGMTGGVIVGKNKHTGVPQMRWAGRMVMGSGGVCQRRNV